MSGPTLALAEFVRIAGLCGSLVAPETVAAVAHHESGLHPYAIGVNGAPHLGRSPATRAEAERLVASLLAAGYRSLDLGLMQLNWAAGHLQSRGLPITAAFDRRISVRVGCEVLADCYRRAPGPNGQLRLRAALGCYNTGRPNPLAPYVQRIQASADKVVPLVPAIQVSPTARLAAPIMGSAATNTEKGKPLIAIRSRPASRRPKRTN